MKIDGVPSVLRARGLIDIAAEWELMQEALTQYANDEDRYLNEAECDGNSGEPFGSISTEVGIKARQHRGAFQRRVAGACLEWGTLKVKDKFYG